MYIYLTSEQETFSKNKRIGQYTVLSSFEIVQTPLQFTRMFFFKKHEFHKTDHALYHVLHFFAILANCSFKTRISIFNFPISASCSVTFTLRSSRSFSRLAGFAASSVSPEFKREQLRRETFNTLVSNMSDGSMYCYKNNFCVVFSNRKLYLWRHDDGIRGDLTTR